MDHRNGGFDGNSAIVKKEIDRIKVELASTIYCSAMISELGDGLPDSIDFYNDCNSLSTALTKIYAMRFRSDPIEEIERLEQSGRPICNYKDVEVVVDSLMNIASSTNSQVIAGIMSGCSNLAKSILRRIDGVEKK